MKKRCTVKKRLAIFPSPARMSLTKLSLAGKSLIIPGQGEFVCDIPAGDGKIANLFYSVLLERRRKKASVEEEEIDGKLEGAVKEKEKRL